MGAKPAQRSDKANYWVSIAPCRNPWISSKKGLCYACKAQMSRFLYTALLHEMGLSCVAQRSQVDMLTHWHPIICRRTGQDVSRNAFMEQAGGLSITDVDPEAFKSIDFRDKTLTPSSSQEPKVHKEASFMDRILRGGSGCVQADSLVSNL